MADTEVIADTTEKMSTEDISTVEPTPKEDITDEEPQPSKTIKEELLKVETEELAPKSITQETVDENGDVFEETTEVTRKVVKRTMKITETSSSTKTTTMTTPAKLYGKDLSEYDEVDVDALLAQLSPEEINILAKEVDPDDNFLPPNQRCSYECTKDPTGPLDRKKLIEHINKEAMETPDLPEIEPYVKGTVRGKKWVPPPRDERELAAEEQIAIDMGDEYEHALSDATQEEIIDLAAILGFHSMMNQDQYHASLLNKGQPVGLGWDGITKSTTQKLYPMDPPNNTDVEESIKRVKDDDPKLIELNLNNIKNISDEKFEQLFDALPQNEHLEVLSLTNVGLTDKTALLLAEAIEKSKTLRVLNVETNFINPPVIVTLVKALLKARTIEEFRASNQRSTVLGNKIEMEITDLVEKNASLLRLGLHLEFNDARHRVAAHLQRNIDRNEHELRKGTSSSPVPNSTAGHAGIMGDLSSMQKTNKAKPVHSVLTPQERIDSKSDLIASLMSQKLSDRGKGEISLAVPQISGRSRSPSRDRVTAPKVENDSPQKAVNHEEVSPVQAVATLQTATNPTEKKDEKLPSPVRRPKIGELRDSNLSKAVEEESASVEESGNLFEPSSISEKPAVTEIDVKDLVPIKPSEDQAKSLNDENLPKTLNNLPPNETESKSIVDLPKLQIEVPSAPVTLETSLTVESVETIKDQSKRNERISESISPSRQMEDKLTLLQAKIDSFAEVADEKLSSLRLKFDDIARDSSLNTENKEPFSPKQAKESVKVDEAVLLDKQNEAESKPNEPVTLPPKIPHRKASLSKISPLQPLIRSPNSIGISFVFQKQIFPREETQRSSTSTDHSNGEPLQILANVEAKIAETIPEKINTALSPVPTLNKNVVISDQGTDKVPAATNPQIEEIISNSPNPIQAKTHKNLDELKPTIGDRTKLATSEPAIDRESKKVASTLYPSDELQPSDLKRATVEVDTQLAPNIGTQITSMKSLQEFVMSRLSVKKGESVHIVETKKVEAETQSLIQPPPSSRLSFKKCDSQKIDPVPKTEVATQSISKPNPLSLLSLKKCDLVDIKPAARSEQSTQFSFQEPKSEASSQTVEDEPMKVVEETTQTPLVFSSLEHDYIFPGLRRVPHLPRPKTINIGDGDRVIIKPSSKPINEVLMLLYPVLHDHSTSKPQEQVSSSSKNNFGLEVDLVKDREPEGTIKILEDTLKKAVDASDSILKAEREPSPDSINQENIEEIASIKTEIEIPLESEPKTEDQVMASHIESKFTAVEEVSAMSRTTIASEARMEVIDKAYKSIAAVSSAEAEQVSKTSIRSANMWESLSSNLIKASEQTLIDIAKNANSGESRTKIGKVSVYSSIEDLSNSSRSKYGDRHIGGLIKTVEKTSIYSSSEDLPLLSYTKYSDRYGDEHVKKASKSVYSSTEDLLASTTRTKYSERYANDIVGKSSAENLAETLYSKYSDRSIHTKAETSRSNYTSVEDLTLLPASKFSDRYKEDNFKPVDNHRLSLNFPVSQGSYYKSNDHSTSRSQYKSAETLSYRTKINDRASHEITKSNDTSLQTAIMSSISRNQSALRPYTYVPTSIIPEPVSILDRSRPSSPVAKHTTTLQLNISPSGISELHSNRGSKYISKENIDRPKIFVSRPKDENRYTRAVTPIERSRPSAHLLSPHREISRQTNDHSTVESTKSTLDISSASAAITPTNDTINSTPNTPPKKRANIMDTIKMLKNRVRDVITTEDRFSETHRLPSYSSIPSSSTSEIRRAARANARMTSSSLNYPHDNDEKEI